jgi:GTPase involved in cell partitioning and DNA repair
MRINRFRRKIDCVRQHLSTTISICARRKRNRENARMLSVLSFLRRLFSLLVRMSWCFRIDLQGIDAFVSLSCHSCFENPWCTTSTNPPRTKVLSSPDGDDDASTMYYSPNKPLDGERFVFSSTVECDASLLDDPLIDGDSAGTRVAGVTATTNEYSFFDEAVVTVRAGSGGQGSSTYKKGTGGQDGIADGGNGGRGGNVIFVTDPSLNTLAGLSNSWRPNSFGGSGAAAVTSATNLLSSTKSIASTTNYPTKHFRAENGGNGERMYNNGRFGIDVVVRLPPGTVVQELIIDHETGEVIEVIDVGSLGTADNDAIDDEEENGKDKVKIRQTKAMTTLLVARGGEGGEGSAAAGKRRGVKRSRLPPRSGERKTLKLTLKIVADVALVGVPNAGKSTFLAAVTRYVRTSTIFFERHHLN